MPINPLTGEEEAEELSLDNYDQRRQAQVDENSGYDFGGRTGAVLQALGAGFMGRDPAAAAGAALDRNQRAKDAKLSALDQWKQNKIADIKRGREDQAYQKDQSTIAREQDPNSEESMFAKQAAKRMGYKGVVYIHTAETFSSISLVIENIY